MVAELRLIPSSMRFAAKLLSLLDPAAWRAWNAARLGRDFDRKHGTNTQTHIEVEDLGIVDEPRRQAVHYEASALPKLHRAFKNLNIDEEEYTFIDVGSGKGLVVIETAKRNFREVVGLEISALAHRISEQNVSTASSRAKLKSPIKLLNINALDYDYPAVKQVVYLYNPFGELFISKLFGVLRHRLLEGSTDIVVAYVNPVCLDTVEREAATEMIFAHRSLVVFRLLPPVEQPTDVVTKTEND